MSWQNWSGRQVAPDASLHHAYSEADIQQLMASTSGPVRSAGTGHSHAPLVVTDGTVINTDALSGVVATDSKARTATVWAGTKIYALGRALHEAGLALSNQGDIDRQSITGATGTGTHGTGRTLANLSSAVLGMRLVTATGDVINANANEHPELWQAARLHLGAFGVITQLTLQCREAYRLKQSGGPISYPELEADIPKLIDTHRHYEFFWYPHNDTAISKATDETDDEAVYPVAAEGERCAWSYEVLPNHRPHKHTEMEYSVPAENGLACFAEIRHLLQNTFTDVRWPVEYRTLAADDVWLSTAFERDTVTISVHQDVREDETAYYQACEAIFLRHGGRPHWGKVQYLDAEQMAAIHPRWADWWQVRNDLDPTGRFLNPMLKKLGPT